ncbi:MAG: winged helix-turn-helix domain-containing protein [Vulcanimicrobiota bacterium]
MTELSRDRARRLFMAGQDLLESPRRKASADRAAEIIEHLGFVQIDSINVLERAHHLILGARMDGYKPEFLAQLLEKKRRFFEHWTHDASIIPAQNFPYWHYRFERFKQRIQRNGWWMERLGAEPEAMMEQIRQRLEQEGPLPTRSFREAGEQRGKWWGWTPAKAALEHLWRSGELMIAGRQGFEKVYDLTERVIPEKHLQQEKPGREVVLAWACRSAIERLGVGTASEIGAFWNLFTGAQVDKWCDQNLPKVRVDGRELYARADFEQLEIGEPAARMRLLAPFDPLVRDRKRVAWLFDFDYRFEAFVPEQKRQYGYYVLPILEGERLVGRLDAKFERPQSQIVVRGLWWENGVKPGVARSKRLEKALEGLAGRIGASAISFEG